MTFFRMLPVLAFSALFSGCLNSTSPEGILASAYDALNKDKPKSFNRAFTREFRKNHDMPTVMANVRSALDGIENPTLSAPLQVAQKYKTMPICRALNFPDYQEVESEITYQLNVRGESNRSVLIATVQCAQQYDRISRRAIRSYCYEPSGQVCRISDLK